MSEATAPTPRVETLEEKVDRLTATIAAVNAAVAGYTRATDMAVRAGQSAEPIAWEAVVRVGDFQGDVRHLGGEILGLMTEMATWKAVWQKHEEDQAAVAPAPPKARRRHAARHRGLKLIGVAPLAAFLRRALHAAKLGHVSLAGAKVSHVALLAWGTGSVVAAGGVIVAASALGGTQAHPGGSYGATPNPAASVVSATPIGLRVPSAGIAGLVTRPVTDAKTAHSLPPVVLAPPPWTYPAPSQSQPSVSSGQPGSSQASQSSGYIQTTDTAIAVADPTQDVEIPIAAVGGDTSWHAWITGPSASDVTLGLGSLQGDLPDGTGGYLDVSIDAAAQAAGGTVTVHVWPGDVAVVLTWQPVTPAAPSPAATVTVAPSPASS